MQPELKRLHAKLNSQQYADRPGVVLIAGLPGAGKTYLARQYVWSHRGSYQDGIFWIGGKSLSSVQDGFDEIAQVLRKGYISSDQIDLTNSSTRVVHDYLHLRKNWLLVFDGVPPFETEEDATIFAQFLPVNVNHGSFLYTSVDRTAAKQSQFYEPYLLQVPPLSIEDSCKMLFSRLGIKRPTSAQIQKACMVARHYEGLPLAIYAVGNYLSSTAKAIERFSVNSRPTDSVLSEPFVAVLERLRLSGHCSALNLMNILCFYDSPVQINLVLLGMQSLREHEAMTTKTGLEVALKSLSRHGLVGTDSDDAVLSNGDTTKLGEDTPTVVNIHPVVRSVCRDQLRATDLANPRENRYESCLLAAFDVLNTSYHNALASYNSTGDEKLDHETKEHYKLHVSSLVDHFPRKGYISPEVSQAYGQLIGMSMCIDDEACTCRLPPSNSDSFLDGAGKSYGRGSQSHFTPSPSLLPRMQNGHLPRPENSDSDDDGWKIVVKNKGDGKQAGGNIRSNTMDTAFQTTQPTIARAQASMSTRTHPSAFMPGELQSSSINRRRTDGSVSNTSRKGSSYFDSRRSM